MSTMLSGPSRSDHHPAIRARRPVTTTPPDGFDLDFLGTRTRRAYWVGMLEDRGVDVKRPARPPMLPAVDEEYFEWVDVLESVDEAVDSFVMVELGAGYGRWCIRAAVAARERGLGRVQLVAVEAEPDHFAWMLQHFRDNGFEPRDHELFWAVVGRSAGLVPFWIGKADSWYGQAVAHRADTSYPDVRARRRLRARAVLGRPPVLSADERRAVWVPGLTLKEILEPYRRIDLLDIDVQGAETDVLGAAIGVLDTRVRRVHIGTHSAQIEDSLRTLFERHGWEKVNDYSCHGRTQTPYGDVQFGDGVQTWLNPRLRPGPGPLAEAAMDPPTEVDRKHDLQDTVRRTRRRLQTALSESRDVKQRNRELKTEVANLRRRVRDAEDRLKLSHRPQSAWQRVVRRLSGWWGAS